MVREFINAFQANTDPEMCLKLIREEAKELREAFAHVLKEMADLAYVSYYAVEAGVPDGYAEADDNIEGAARVMDALSRIVGDDLMQEVFTRVHRSNMSKLGDDGRPLRREDGKILKGPNYREPNLMDLV